MVERVTVAAPTRLPAAASAAVAPVLTGPVRDARVLAAFPAALHIGTGDAELPLVCLATPDAVLLPCAVVVRRLPAARAGDRVRLGGGRIVLGAVEVAAARWVRPPRPRLRDVPGARRRAVELPAEPPAMLPLDPSSGLDGQVRALLGLGPGVTPAGDDVLAGALVALRAAADPAADRLAAAVAAAEPLTRTSTVSAALLGHAARGEAIPELAGLLGALDGRGPLPPAVRRLQAVGESSGAALIAGVRLALRARVTT
jgi:hypothetical protein